MEAVACIADDAPPWSGVLAASRELIGADSGSLIMLDGKGALMHVSHQNIGASTVDAYMQHFHKLDMVSQVALKQDVGIWLDTNDSISRKDLLQSDFHTDYLRPHRSENTVRKQIASLKIKLDRSRGVDLVRLSIIARE